MCKAATGEEPAPTGEKQRLASANISRHHVQRLHELWRTQHGTKGITRRVNKKTRQEYTSAFEYVDILIDPIIEFCAHIHVRTHEYDETFSFHS